MESALKNAALEEIAGIDKNAIAIELTTRSLLIILPRGNFDGMDNLLSRCNRFISKFRRYFECNLCCYLIENTSIHELLDRVQALKDADLNNVTKINQVIKVNYGHNRQSIILRFPTSEWLELMKVNSKEELMIKISDYIKSWGRNDLNITYESLQFFHQEFLQMIFYMLQIRGLKADQVFSRNLLTKNTNEVLKSVNSLRDWIMFIIDLVMDQLHQSHESNSLVDKVKQFIKENIGTQKLTRDNIANYVHFNPDYVTRVFKKETGFSLSEYIQQERIEIAKKLLIHTDKSVSEVALESGYTNFSYFSTIFKKITNFSPVDYRKNTLP